MRTRRSTHLRFVHPEDKFFLELSTLVVQLLRLLFVLLFLFLLLFLNFSTFSSSPALPSSCSFSSSSSWKLFLLGFLHADLNGEDYELRVPLRQVLLSAFLQELGLVLLQAPNHFRSSVDPSMDNLSVFCVN